MATFARTSVYHPELGDLRGEGGAVWRPAEGLDFTGMKSVGRVVVEGRTLEVFEDVGDDVVYGREV